MPAVGQFFRSFLTLLLSTALAVGMLTVLPAGLATATPAEQGQEQADSRAVMAEARASGHRVEDIAQRDEYTKVYANPDGTWTAEISSGPERVQDEDGEWHDIDTSLVARDGGWGPAHASGDLVFSAGGDRTFASLTVDGEHLEWRWPTRLPEPQVDGATATYVDAVSGGDLVVTAMPTGFRHDIVLREAPADPVEFTMPVVTGESQLAKTPEGGIEVTDPQGETLLSAATPLMWDADRSEDGEPVNVKPVAVKVAATAAGTQTLTLAPASSFLHDNETQYPVTIDPTYTASASDAWIQNIDNTNARGGSEELQVGTDNGGARKSRSYLHFDNIGPVIGTTINSATLVLRNFDSTSCRNAPIRVRRITESWRIAQGYADSLNWDNQPAVGSSYAEYSPAHGGGSSCPAANATWDVEWAVADWAKLGINEGLRVTSADEKDSDSWRRYRSANYTVTEGYRPKLVINYTAKPPTIASGSPAVSDSVTSNGSTVTRNLTPTFTATATDLDSNTVNYRFEVRDLSGTVLAASSGSKENTRAAMNFSWKVPAGILTEKGSYKAAFSIADETTTAGPWAYRDFTVDQVPAVPTSLTVEPTSSTSPLTTPVTDPELSAVLNDPDPDDQLTATFEVRKQGETAVLLIGEDEVTSGERALYALSPEDGEALTPGATYEFRVGSQDTTDLGANAAPRWSGWVAFAVTKDASVSTPLQLAEPLTVWDQGPDLTWTSYREDPDVEGDELVEYQVFRSCLTTPTPECGSYQTYDEARTAQAEPVGTLDPGQRSFRDRTAVPSSATVEARYRYWVVARTVADGQADGSTASNARDVTTPRSGRVRRVFLGDVPDATISSTKADTPFPKMLQVDSADPADGKQRALLDFDVSVIQPGMRVTSAAVSVHQSNAGSGGQFGLHTVKDHDFLEGEVTWNNASATDPWATAGGDLTTPATSTATAQTQGEVAFADSTEMRAAVQRWVNQQGDNHGVAIRAVDESPTGRRFLDLVPSESTQLDPTALTQKRPRLTVEHMTVSTLDTIYAPDLPQRYVPGTITSVPVRITNTTDTAFQAGLQLSYRWTLPGGTEDQLTADAHRYTDLKDSKVDATDGLQPGESVLVDMPLSAPINSDTGSQNTRYDLHLDLWNPVAKTWYTATPMDYRYYNEADLSADQRAARDELLADGGCAMVPTALKCTRRVVEAATSTGLGLEKFGSYQGEETGAGTQALANLANGNLVWSYDAISNPSVGPSFFARIAYNSSDVGGKAENPAGGFGWSVQPGTLARLNTPLTLSGSAYKAITLTDGDGTQHRWQDPVADTNGVLTYRRPAGVPLDLLEDPNAVAEKRYQFRRPDGTRFYFAGTGHASALLPSSTVDLSGNALNYQYTTGNGEDRMLGVVDAKGRTVATLNYNSAGRVQAICDISGRALVFGYGPGGTQLASVRDGKLAAGSSCAADPSTGQGAAPTLEASPSKEFGFAYSDAQANDSTNLVKVTDPRGNATGFGYYAKNDGAGDLDALTYPTRPTITVPTWVNGKLRSWVDRRGRESQVEYYQPGESLPADVEDGMPAGSSVLGRVIDRGAAEPYISEYGIDAYGRTIEIKDADSNATNTPNPQAATRLAWDADHNVVRMEEQPNGAVSRWLYNADSGYPTRIWDAEAVRSGTRPTRLAYQTLGNGVVFLKSITTPLGKTTTFTPDAVGRLATVRDPEGGTTDYLYNPIDGTLESATDPRGNKTTFKYPAAADNVGYPTEITPPAAIVAGDVPDAPVTFQYDARGNVLKTTQQDTTNGTTTTLVTTATYDVFGRPLTVTRPGAQGPDRTTAYTYDDNDNVETTTAPNGAVTSQTYAADDQLVRTKLPGNGSSGDRFLSVGYDGLGRVCREIAPKGTHPADPLTPVTCPSSESTIPPAYATDYWYDTFDNLGRVTSTVRVDDAGSRVTTSQTVDAVGDVVKVIDAEGNKTAEITYDLNHQPVQSTDALGYSTRTVYDADGQVIQTVDQDGNPTEMTYDDAGRLETSTVLYDRPGREVQRWTTRFTYDKAGNRIQVTRPRQDANGEPYFSRVVYDENNRPVVTQRAFNSSPASEYTRPATTFLTYDPFGRMDAQSVPVATDPLPSDLTKPLPTAPAGTLWNRFTHFDSGDIKTSKDPSGITTAYTYTRLGQQATRTLTGATAAGEPSAQSRSMSWSYYPDGSLQSRSDTASPAAAAFADNPGGTAVGAWELKTPSNRAGQQGADYHTHATGAVDTFVWTLTPPATGKYRVEFSCPAIGRNAAGESLEPGPRTTSATYSISSGAGTASATVSQADCGDSPWRTVTKSVTLNGATTVTLAASASGAVVADAVRLVALDLDRDFTYAYDANGQNTSVVDNTPGVRVTEFTTRYDVLGAPKEVKELSGATTLRTTTYTHDANGNVLTVDADRNADSGNQALNRYTTYTWDARNQVDTVAVTNNADDTGARTWDYTWNSRGLLERLRKPGATAGTAGNTVRFGYYANSLMRFKHETNSTGTVARHDLTYTPDGDPARDIAVVQSPGGGTMRQTSTYTYGPDQQLLKVDKTGRGVGKDEEYWYDAAGNIDKQRIDKLVTDFTYEFNRLKTADIGGQPATYSYDPFGRLTDVTGPAPAKYMWDGFDRLYHEEHGPGLLVKKDTLFDALDRAVEETVTNGTTTRKTRFNYLGTSEQVAAEEQPTAPGASTWKVTKVFNYGPDDRPLMMTSTPLSGDPKTRYYSTNPRGDVEALTDPTGGQNTATYRYYAYGSLDETGTKGEDAKDTTPNSIKEPLNPYRYNGNRVDTATGGIDMGFRNYDPGLNQFLTRDMYNGALADMRLGLDPWNANRYAFAGGNPITRVELDGHMNTIGDWGGGGGYVAPPEPEDEGGFLSRALSGTVEVAKDTVGVGKGVAEGVKDTAVGIKDLGVAGWDCAGDLGQCGDDLSAFGSQVKNDPQGVLGGMWNSIKDPIVADWKAGNQGEAIGRGAWGAVEVVFGAKGLTKLGRVGRAPKTPAVGDDLLKPGPWAKSSVPSTAPGKITQAERNQLNPIGNQYGCHSCGTTTSGTKSGNWIGDHQPPSRLANGAPQVLYPHCQACSNAQGLHIINLIRKGVL